MTLQPFVHHVPDRQQPGGASRIMEFAANLSAAATAMESLIDTPFIPVSFWPLPKGVQIRDFPTPQIQHPRESVEEHARRRQVACASASAAVLYGDELGYGAIAALSSVYVVRGRPGLYAEAMVALVKSHGHELAVEDLTDSRCVIRGRRKGDTEWQRFTFTMDRARKAGYVKQNQKYNDDPQTMLYARCSSIACRSIAPDVLKGIASVEEITDEVDIDAQPVRTRTVKRAEVAPATTVHALGRSAAATETGNSAITTTVAETARQPSGPPLPGEESAPAPLDQRQWDAINRQFVQLEVVGDGQKASRLAVISYIVGRPIARGGELTAAEGQLVLDNLAGDTGHRIVGHVLIGADEVAERPGQQVAAHEHVVADAGDADPGTDEEYDPTTEPGWGAMDGAEAEAEADRG